MKKKTMTKLFSLVVMGVMLMASVFSLSACGGRQEFTYDYVSVFVYDREKFENEEFTLEDFNWENAKSISYYHRPSSVATPEFYGWISVYLKKQSKSHVLAAKAHIEQLDFVERVGLNFIDYPL